MFKQPKSQNLSFEKRHFGGAVAPQVSSFGYHLGFRIIDSRFATRENTVRLGGTLHPPRHRVMSLLKLSMHLPALSAIASGDLPGLLGEKVPAGSWMCEAALWVDWHNRGLTNVFL